MITTNFMTRRNASLALALALCALTTACKKDLPERRFNSAEEAAAALVTAAEQFDVPSLKAILGSSGDELVASADTVLDRNRAMAFAAEAKAQQRLEYDSTKTSAVLLIGTGEWPVPMPIINDKGKWYFDVESGRDEVLLRRIGRNELDAIQAARTYVDAQWQYSLAKHDSSIVHQYAQRVISTPGKHDGLTWMTKDSTWEGPLGEHMARFIAEGYKDRYEPFHGYYFKILKGQGPAAPLGEMDFLVKGAMIGGFALVATPAEYLVTGVKTFIVSHDGIVYEKDLGEKSVDLFKAMDKYNPDSTWTKVPND